MAQQTETYPLSGGAFNDGSAFSLFWKRYDIGTSVIRWDHSGGFDGYTRKRVEFNEENRKTGRVRRKVIKGARYGRRKLKHITQFLVHHSGGDGSDPRNMYQTLYMRRKLSVQFAIEDDGRIYQFNDGGDLCWHAGKHNKRSIGVECCLYPLAGKKPQYYSDRRNARLGNLPHEIQEDVIHGQRMRVFAFTAPQVEALARLTAGVWIALNDQRRAAGLVPLAAPPLFPRDRAGRIPRTVAPQALRHEGLIGHLQCTRRKIDPAGFPWETFEQQAAEHYTRFESEAHLCIGSWPRE